MKHGILIIILFSTVFISCNNVKTNHEVVKLSADSLIANIDKYCNTKVETEGVITHICGVDGKKMKLKTESGEIIKIVPNDSIGSFDTSYYKKKIKVRGIVSESRIEISFIDKMEKEKALLCHIDHTPCKDTAWVNYQIKKGVADTISKQDIEKLKIKLKQIKKKYISVVTIVAEKVEIIGKAEL